MDISYPKMCFPCKICFSGTPSQNPRTQSVNVSKANLAGRETVPETFWVSARSRVLWLEYRYIHCPVHKYIGSLLFYWFLAENQSIFQGWCGFLLGKERVLETLLASARYGALLLEYMALLTAYAEISTRNLVNVCKADLRGETWSNCVAYSKE